MHLWRYVEKVVTSGESSWRLEKIPTAGITLASFRLIGSCRNTSQSTRTDSARTSKNELTSMVYADNTAYQREAKRFNSRTKQVNQDRVLTPGVRVAENRCVKEGAAPRTNCGRPEPSALRVRETGELQTSYAARHVCTDWSKAGNQLLPAGWRHSAPTADSQCGR